MTLPPRRLSIAILLILSPVISAAGEILPLWPGMPPNHRESKLREIAEVTDFLRIRQVQQPAIEIFLPPPGRATGQAVIICPGGGYRYLSYEKEGTRIAGYLNQQGIAGIVLKYRLPEDASNVVPWLSPLFDAQRALRLVRQRAADWNLRPDHIGIMGFSAGGNLAANAGTRFDAGDAGATDPVDRESCRPDFLILVYPVVSLREGVGHAGSRLHLVGESPSSELVDAYSAELLVSHEPPPTFLVHAGDDQAVPVENSLLFYAALRIHAVPAALHVFPKGGHGFGLSSPERGAHQWPDLCVDWLRELLQP